MSNRHVRSHRIWPTSLLLMLLFVHRSPGEELKPAIKLPPGYKLVWHDEFDGTELNLHRWEYRYLGKRDGAIVSKESVSLDGKGHLLLTTRKNGADLLIGMIGTQKTFRQKYGYFEARIKFEKLQGHHGSFWLQSPLYGKFKDDPGKSGAELDIIEFFGSGRPDHGARVNVYWNPYPKPDKVSITPDVPALLKNKHGSKAAKELCDDFHTYGLLWTAKEYVFFIDGKEVLRTSKGLSHTEQYIVLSLLASEWERARLDLKRLPDAMVVDYVRVYAKR